MTAGERVSREFGRGRESSRAEAKPIDFAEVYDEQVWRVYAFVGYRVKSREEAEDLTQLTFERALKAWARFDPSRASASTWLLAIARNLVIDHYRRDQPVPVEELEDLVGAAEDPSVEARLGLAPELERALDSLSERDRELIALRFGGDLNGPEIAEMTGLSLANVQQILSRSLRSLRVELESSSVAELSSAGRQRPDA